MAGITLAQAEAKLATWMAADDAVAGGQGYSIAGRSLTRANSREIQDKIEYWDNKVKKLSRTSGIRFRSATPTG